MIKSKKLSDDINNDNKVNKAKQDWKALNRKFHGKEPKGKRPKK